MKIAIAGSTHRTTQCAQAVMASGTMSIAWVLTPPPKPIGRAQTLTPNPLQVWATQQQVPIVEVPNKIDQDVETQITSVNRAQPCDVLLVVDFGYLIPQWLLRLPQLAPLNIHPSALPNWRGSSPGQFVLLAGETHSAVTLMVMDEGLDSGPLIKQYSFTVGPDWTQAEYYHHSFDLICQHLVTDITAFAAGELTASPQPALSPTPLANRLSKIDSFVEWLVVQQAMQGQPVANPGQSATLLQTFASETGSWAITLERATRAFSPWPGLWTFVPTAKGPQRMKVLSSHLNNDQLVLDRVQLEGKNPANWREIKNSVL